MIRYSGMAEFHAPPQGAPCKRCGAARVCEHRPAAVAVPTPAEVRYQNGRGRPRTLFG